MAIQVLPWAMLKCHKSASSLALKGCLISLRSSIESSPIGYHPLSPMIWLLRHPLRRRCTPHNLLLYSSSKDAWVQCWLALMAAIPGQMLCHAPALLPC